MEFTTLASFARAGRPTRGGPLPARPQQGVRVASEHKRSAPSQPQAAEVGAEQWLTLKALDIRRRQRRTGHAHACDACSHRQQAVIDLPPSPFDATAWTARRPCRERCEVRVPHARVAYPAVPWAQPCVRSRLGGRFGGKPFRPQERAPGPSSAAVGTGLLAPAATPDVYWSPRSRAPSQPSEPCAVLTQARPARSPRTTSLRPSALRLKFGSGKTCRLTVAQARAREVRSRDFESVRMTG